MSCRMSCCIIHITSPIPLGKDRERERVRTGAEFFTCWQRYTRIQQACSDCTLNALRKLTPMTKKLAFASRTTAATRRSDRGRPWRYRPPASSHRWCPEASYRSRRWSSPAPGQRFPAVRLRRTSGQVAASRRDVIVKWHPWPHRSSRCMARRVLARVCPTIWDRNETTLSCAEGFVREALPKWAATVSWHQSCIEGFTQDIRIRACPSHLAVRGSITVLGEQNTRRRTTTRHARDRCSTRFIPI